MKPPKPRRNIRAYIRPTRDYSEAAQRRELEPLNPVVIYVDKPVTRTDAMDYRTEWINSLRPEAGDVAAVARLWVIPKRKRNDKDMRPSADFVATMTELLAKGVPIIEAASGVSSADLPAWRELLQRSAKRIAQGRGHSPRVARRYGKRGGAVSTARSIAKRWLSPEMDAERKAAGRTWRDPMHANLEEALAELPKEIGTRGLAYKILGKRKPRQRGGRPRSI